MTVLRLRVPGRGAFPGKLLLLWFPILAFVTLQLRAAEKQIVRMAVQEGKLRYTVEAFTAQPGADVEIYFRNNDHEMMHNVVICKNEKGVHGEVGMAAVMLGDKAEAMKYVPKHPSILFASDLVRAGETKTFRFTAPTEEGDYPYLCTLPGHYMVMRGIMTVASNAPTVDSPLYNLKFVRYASLSAKPNLDTFASFSNPISGEIESGLLNLMIGNLGGDTDNTQPFALEFEGQLLIPKTGSYRFTLDLIGIVELTLGEQTLFRNTNGRKTVVENSEPLSLKRGIYPLRMKYLAYHGPVYRKRSLRGNLKLAIKGPDGNYKQLTQSMPQPVAPSTELVPDTGDVYLYRSAVEGSGPASIHVGYDDGISYSFDTKSCLLTQAWSGGFLNAAGDWNGRGGSGATIIGKRFYQLKETLPAFFVADAKRPAAVLFKSYRLGPSGAPTFHLLIDNLPAALDVLKEGGQLRQRISVSSGAKPLFYQVDGKRQAFTLEGDNAALEIEVGK